MIPKCSNLIGLHHFFDVKNDGKDDKLKLKCRLTPHGNRDKDKKDIRKDSSTAQFPIIRLTLSIFSILQFSITTLDVKSTYLQRGSISRDVCIRPPKGWTKSRFIAWKLKNYTYKLVEFGRIWKLVVQDWMAFMSLFEVPGLVLIRTTTRG